MPKEIRSEAFYRLRYLVGRLSLLVELKAPDAILIRESLLVAEAAERLGPEKCRELAEDLVVGRAKRLADLCATDTCEDRVAWIPSAQKPRLPAAFQDTHCPRHARELDAAAAAAELAAEEDGQP